MAFPPEAYLIGAQKAGTTTLAELLDLHPAIAVSDPKETRFVNLHWSRGLDWYRRCFPADEGRIFVDASPDYSSLPVPCPPAPPPSPGDPRRDVVERLYQMRPDARFIYILRDPVARTHSGYWHAVRAGHERRPFREAILADSIYLRTGCYAEQIEHYLTRFPIDRFLILVFEEIRTDMIAAAQACYLFLGAEPTDFAPEDSPTRNQSYVYTGAGRAVTNLIPTVALRKAMTRLAKQVLPDVAQNALRRALTQDVPPLGPDDRAFLAEVFADHNARLERLLGRRFEPWTRPGRGT